MTDTIYEVLEKEHEEMKALFEKALAAHAHPLKHLKKIEKHLYLHSKAEEKAFYNRVKDKVGVLKTAFEVGDKEHHMVLEAFDTMLNESLEREECMALLKQIQTSLLGHIYTEETELFKAAQKVLSHEEAQEVAEAFERIKEELAEERYQPA